MREKCVEPTGSCRRAPRRAVTKDEHLNLPRVYIAFASVGLWVIIIGVAKLVFWA